MEEKRPFGLFFIGVMWYNIKYITVIWEEADYRIVFPIYTSAKEMYSVQKKKQGRKVLWQKT